MDNEDKEVSKGLAWFVMGGLWVLGTALISQLVLVAIYK